MFFMNEGGGDNAAVNAVLQGEPAANPEAPPQPPIPQELNPRQERALYKTFARELKAHLKKNGTFRRQLLRQEGLGISALLWAD
jgi:hypothetical protein